MITRVAGPLGIGRGFGAEHVPQTRHGAFIQRATEVLKADDRVLAADLVGGFAVGQGDAFSDLQHPGLAVPASNGVILMRDVGLVRLFLAEQGRESTREMAGIFPFTKRLRRYLSDRQHLVLESLPPVQATIDSAIAGFIALAEAFLPRAQRLAAATGATWPGDYTDAGVAYFERAVGARLEVGHSLRRMVKDDRP